MLLFFFIQTKKGVRTQAVGLKIRRMILASSMASSSVFTFDRRTVLTVGGILSFPLVKRRHLNESGKVVQPLAGTDRKKSSGSHS